MTTLQDYLRDDIRQFVAEHETDIQAIDEEAFLEEIMETIKEVMAKYVG